MEKAKQGLPKLPTELIEEILSRVPVKSLCRFRCVCKSWNDLVGEPNFMSRQLNRSIENETKLFLLTDSGFFLVDFTARGYGTLTTELRFPFQSRNCPFDSSILDLRLAGSCNGLICFDIANPHTTYIWNPCTGDYKILPHANFLLPRPVPIIVVLGFGYSPASDKYKVVRFVNPGARNNESECIIHTLGTDSWRSIERLPYKMYLEFTGVYLNGTLHWFAQHNPESIEPIGCIACFDVEEEKFSGLELPDSEAQVYPTGLAVLGGLLSITCHFDWTHFETWVMQEYGVERSWTRLVYGRMPDFRIKSFRFQPLGTLINGKIVISFYGKRIALYDIRMRKFRTAPIYCKAYRINGCAYVESLLSPRILGDP